MILRIALILSLLIHVVLSVMFQHVFPFHWPPKRLRAYQVELVRSAVDDLLKEEWEASDIENPGAGRTDPQGALQDAISLDTEDERYASYFGIIKSRIMREWGYPQKAKERLIEGKLLAIFSLLRDGRMNQIFVSESSGHGILDREAIRAIRSAAPFPPFPGHIAESKLHIKVSLDYRLTSKRSGAEG